VQNLVGIGAVVSTMSVLMFCEFGLKMHIHATFLGVWGILLPRWDTSLTNLPNVKSTDHNCSSGVLIILLSVVVSEKLPEQKNV